MKYRLEELSPYYLKKVLSWRNSTRISKNMYSEERISLDEHRQWFNRMQKSDKYLSLLFFINDTPMGVVNFTDIDYVNKHCEWGFYIGEEQAPKGAGTIMAYLSLNHIFNRYDLNKVYGEVLAYNNKSQAFHEKMGFMKEGYLKEHIFKRDKYFDVYTFGILQSDWVNDKQPRLYTYLKRKGVSIQ